MIPVLQYHLVKTNIRVNNLYACLLHVTMKDWKASGRNRIIDSLEDISKIELLGSLRGNNCDRSVHFSIKKIAY